MSHLCFHEESDFSEENDSRTIAPRKIVTRIIAPRTITPSMIDHRIIAPRNIALRIITSEENCPPKNCPRIIPPGKLP